VLSAEAHVGRFRLGGGAGIVLRLSRVYGPGKASAEHIDSVSKGRVPIVGNGRNYVSSVHVDDAATALVSALTVPDGTYNVTDDRPVTAAEHTESLSELLGAPTPRRIPESEARLALGKDVGRLTRSQRVSNRRFVHATGWSPLFPSVLKGWRDVVDQTLIERQQTRSPGV
jgi:nucleoside-diphosphate-sugar epimerase